MTTKTTRLVAAAGLCLLGAWLVVTASRLEIDFFDGFQILNNARRLSGQEAPEMSRHRGVLAGPLYAPVFLLERLWGPGFPALELAHLLAATLTLALVGLAAWRLGPWAALALFLNPLVLHYGPFVKEDLPAALLAFAALCLLERGKSAGAACLAAACALRPQLLPPALVTLAVAHRRGLPLFLALALLGFPALGGETPGSYLAGLVQQWRDNQQGYRSPATGLALLLASVPWVVLPPALAGVKRAPPIWRLWTACLVFPLLAVPGKEARYFLPWLPALYLFAAEGVKRLTDRPRAVAAALLVALCLPAGWREIRRFRDPVFFDPYPRRLAEGARDAAAPGGRVIWVGSFYPLHPRDYVFHPRDDYFALYHLWYHVLAFHSRREVRALPFVDWEGDRPRELPGDLRDGDVLVINAEPRSYVTKDLVPPLRPLSLRRVEVEAAPSRLRLVPVPLSAGKHRDS